MKRIVILLALILMVSCAKKAVPQVEPKPDDTAIIETPAPADEGIVVEPFNVDRGEGTVIPGMVEEPYMIKRGDYLSKIAKNEFGNWRKWREIYDHNQNGRGSGRG